MKGKIHLNIINWNQKFIKLIIYICLVGKVIYNPWLVLNYIKNNE